MSAVPDDEVARVMALTRTSWAEETQAESENINDANTNFRFIIIPGYWAI